MTNPVSVLLSQHGGVYNKITEKNFGGNFVTIKNDTSPGGVFDYGTSRLGITNLRFPAGAAETVFDIRDPNDASGGKTSLKDFFSYAAAGSHSITIVVPMSCFEPNGKASSLSGNYNSNELKKFVELCVEYTKQYKVEISAFEIGNEYWSDSKPGRASEYGRAASKAVEVISDSLNAEIGKNNPQPDIFVQLGTANCLPINVNIDGEFRRVTDQENRDIVAEFSTKALRSIDGMVQHNYGAGNLENFKSDMGHDQLSFWKSAINSAGGIGDSLTLNWTEWNVQAGGSSVEYGLRQASSIVNHFFDGVGFVGVNTMNIWPTFYPDVETSLTIRTSEGPRLTAAGKTFKMMSESLVGTRRIDINEGSPLVDIMAFKESGDRLIVFATSRSGKIQDVDLNLGDLTAGYHHVWAKSLYLSNPADSVSSRMSPTVLTGISSDQMQTDNDAALDIKLRPYEVVRLEFTVARRGVKLSGDEQDDSSDRLVGSAYADSIFGYGGDDYLKGNGGNDTIVGGNGNDTLHGGAGADNMNGGAGNDIYWIDDKNDIIVEAANGGTDRINSTIPISLNRADGAYANVEEVWLQGNADIGAWGSAANNRLVGNSGANVLNGYEGDDLVEGGGGNDSLWGAAGNDTLNGGAGADNMNGGAGNDVYWIDDKNDIIIEAVNGGTDRINSTIPISLNRADGAYANVEEVWLQGSADIGAWGSAANNRLVGNSGANVLNGYEGDDLVEGGGGNDSLWGAAGNDTLNGGAGADIMNGGAGNDVYLVDNTNDIIVEAANGGTDRINSTIGIDLNRAGGAYANVENITLTGSANINAYGSSANNNIVGNSGANLLSGREGNDTLKGGAGADTFLFRKNFDQDIITDFEDNVDTIRLLDFGVTTFAQARTYASQNGNDVVFDFGSGDTLTIRSITINALADDMIFV